MRRILGILSKERKGEMREIVEKMQGTREDSNKDMKAESFNKN